jgi:hypothetical protein
MGLDWKWSGSRWWKCDLHIHTPASHDFVGRENITPEQWVAAAKQAGLHAVAVTDHNTGQWIDKIKDAARDAELVVFPGVEITCGSCHMLVLFDPECGADTVTAFLGRCGISNNFGLPETFSSCSLSDVMAHAAACNGICIGAHVTQEKGVLRTLGQGLELIETLKNPNLHALEINQRDPDLEKFIDNSEQAYQRSHGPLCCLTFSDGHRLENLGSRHTWIKMCQPSLSGLKLALMDGSSSIFRSEECRSAPNKYSALCIESLQIEQARYAGRAKPLQIEFNPWLNSIIGGRGTGKSSLVEFLRVTLDRENELPARLKPDFGELKRVYRDHDDKGLLTDDTVFSLIYRKNDSRYRIKWQQVDGKHSIYEETTDNEWMLTQGEIRSRFPVRIYSQKQIFELAHGSEALLNIIDESAEVNYPEWEDQWSVREKRYLKLCAQIRELENLLSDEGRLRGRISDINRKISSFEKSVHDQTLRLYKVRKQEKLAIDRWLQIVDAVPQKMRKAAIDITIPAIPEEEFAVFAEAEEVKSILQETSLAIEDLQAYIKATAQGIQERYFRVKSALEGVMNFLVCRARRAST